MHSNTLLPGASIDDISMVDHNSGHALEVLQDSQNPKPTNATVNPPETTEQSGKGEERFSYPSYRAFLDTNVKTWPELRWMQVFLEHQCNNPGDTQVDVIDSKDGSLHSSQVPYTGAQNLFKALGHRSSDVNTRIIIVSYRESLSIDRGVVEVLGRLLSIDPLAFLQHFHHENLQQEDSYNDKYKSRLAYEPHAFLPSEQPTQGRCLHFGLESRKYASAMFFGDGFGENNISKATVVIWIRSPRRYYATSFGMHPSFSEPPRRRIVKVHYITGTYVDCLLALDPGVVRMADRDLRQYIAPLIRVFLKEHYVEFRKEIDPFSLFRPTFIHNTPEDLLPRIRHRFRFLDNMRLAIKNVLKEGEDREVRPAEAPIHKTIGDLHVLIDELKEAEGFYERLQREQLLNAQLQEARKSTETAVSVARLTKLAFIFIPLSFVASFFGMNVKQFGNGNINMDIFCNGCGHDLLDASRPHDNDGIWRDRCVHCQALDEIPIRWILVPRVYAVQHPQGQHDALRAGHLSLFQ
ncbi:hypothetical protein GJ744_002376 [Endocarpon pusillum]|uniref:Uncharacterized protein n=1 Tax=Endocarpon pusillum TaxID=364733 RepID=A0A8H7E6G5_9EURO|nr:hypothetical protein GJ744_002376 [Endocarpon pusillum]